MSLSADELKNLWRLAATMAFACAIAICGLFARSELPRIIFQDGGITFSALGKGIRQEAISIVKNLITYRNVTIAGAERYSKEELGRLIGISKGTSVFARTPGEVQEQIERLAWVERVDVTTTFLPLRLHIDILEAAPWLVAEVQQKSWLVSREGHLLQSLEALASPNVIMETMELPRVDGIRSGAELNAAIQAIKLLEEAGGLGWPVVRYTLLDTGALRASFSELGPNELEPAPFGQASPNVQRCPIRDAVFLAPEPAAAKDSLRRFREVTSDLLKRGEVVETLDLRFQNQAILSEAEMMPEQSLR